MPGRTARTLGTIVAIVGIVMIIAGGVTYYMVHNELKAANITVADDAAFLAGDEVDGPFTAYAQAQSSTSTPRGDRRQDLRPAGPRRPVAPDGDVRVLPACFALHVGRRLRRRRHGHRARPDAGAHRLGARLPVAGGAYERPGLIDLPRKEPNSRMPLSQLSGIRLSSSVAQTNSRWIVLGPRSASYEGRGATPVPSRRPVSVQAVPLAPEPAAISTLHPLAVLGFTGLDGPPRQRVRRGWTASAPRCSFGARLMEGPAARSSPTVRRIAVLDGGVDSTTAADRRASGSSR